MSLRSVTLILVAVVATLVLARGPAYAQPGLDLANPVESPTSDTADTDWAYELTGKISASQAAYKDWQGGGVNSLAFSVSLDGAMERKGMRWAQAHTMRLLLGYVDQQDRKIRKSEDLIRLESNLQYQGDGFFKQFNPTIAAKLRTQFAEGFDYSENPYAKHPDHPLADEEAPVQTSGFFSPGTFTESVGLTYDPTDNWSLRFGAASKQTIVREQNFRVLYGVAQDKSVRVEAGGQFASTLDAQLTENIRYRSQLDAFFAVNQLENPPDVIWENVVNLQVNDWLSTDVEFTAMYDEDTVRAIQIKEVISVGVSVSIL